MTRRGLHDALTRRWRQFSVSFTRARFSRSSRRASGTNSRIKTARFVGSFFREIRKILPADRCRGVVDPAAVLAIEPIEPVEFQVGSQLPVLHPNSVTLFGCTLGAVLLVTHC